MVDYILDWLNLITFLFLYTQMVLCFVLNAISLSFIIYSRAFTPINLLIINLSIADILYSSLIPFYSRQFSNDVVSQSELGCRLSFILDVASMLVNVFTVAALTLERYFCLREYKIAENDKSKLTIVIIYIIVLWTLAIGFSMPKTLSIVQIYQNDTGTFACGSLLPQSHEQVFTIAKWIIAFALPYVIIIVFSILLLKFLKEWSAKSKLLHGFNRRPKSFKLNPVNLKIGANKNSVPKTPKNESAMLCESIIPKDASIESSNYQIQSNKKKEFFKCFIMTKNKPSISETVVLRVHTKTSRLTMIKRRTTRFVLAVAISFLCAWSPLWIFQIVITFTETQSLFLKLMSNLTLIIVYLGGVINPLLYMILTHNFREFFSDKIKKVF